MSTQPNTNAPDNSILDINGRQTYLGNTFSFTTTTTFGNTTEEPSFLIVNNSSNKKAIYCDLRRLICLNSMYVIFRLYFNPTITSMGTTSTVLNLRPGSANTSISSVFTPGNFTVSSNGMYHSTLSSSNFSPDVSQTLIILDPGQSLLITSQAGESSPIPAAAELVWYEI